MAERMTDKNFPLRDEINAAACLVLFLDYDGTLADFAPTPDDIRVEAEVVRRVKALAGLPRTTVILLSGRRLKHVLDLVPVEGIWRAGTYGIELADPTGAPRERLDFDKVRPALDRLRPRWQRLIQGRQGFYLEDKGWTLALHARHAEPVEAKVVLAKARRQAERAALHQPFQILGGEAFLEIAPQLADKAATARYFLNFPELQGCLPLYLGDDDKDEAAFQVIQDAGGIAVRVGERPEPTVARYQLASPREARQWLDALLDARVV